MFFRRCYNLRSLWLLTSGIIGLAIALFTRNVNYNNHLTDTVLKDEKKPSTASLDSHQHLHNLQSVTNLKSTTKPSLSLYI
ncbi:Uncharacterised protein [Streptococcus suis]|nr:Uncharacterised protein [Streptococcus suis]